MRAPGEGDIRYHTHSVGHLIGPIAAFIYLFVCMHGQSNSCYCVLSGWFDSLLIEREILQHTFWVNSGSNFLAGSMSLFLKKVDGKHVSLKNLISIKICISFCPFNFMRFLFKWSWLWVLKLESIMHLLEAALKSLIKSGAWRGTLKCTLPPRWLVFFAPFNTPYIYSDLWSITFPKYQLFDFPLKSSFSPACVAC